MRVKDGKATLVPDADGPAHRSARPTRPRESGRSTPSTPRGSTTTATARSTRTRPAASTSTATGPIAGPSSTPRPGSARRASPRSHALIPFAFDHPEIAAVWSFGLNDNLASPPKKPESALDDADLPLFAELSRLFAKATSDPAGPGSGEQGEGEADAREGRGHEEGGSPPSRSPSGRRGRDARTAGGPGDPRRDDRRRPERVGLSPVRGRRPGLAALARAGAAGAEAGGRQRRTARRRDPRRRRGPLAVLERPRHGRPGVRAVRAVRPPDARQGRARRLEAGRPAQPADRAGRRRSREATSPSSSELAQRLPRLAIRDVKVEAEGGRDLPGLGRRWPTTASSSTALAQGSAPARPTPVLVRLEPGAAKILAGPARRQIDALAGSGGRKEFRWLILRPAPARTPRRRPTITLHASSPKAGQVSLGDRAGETGMSHRWGED